MLGLIIRSFDYLDKNSYIRLYKAMIRPQLEYGNAVWHHYLSKDIDSIEAVQKGFTKLIPGLRDLSYQVRLKHLKLPSLAHRRRRGDIIQCFKIIKGLDDIPCERFFTFAESRTRGHSIQADPVVEFTANNSRVIRQLCQFKILYCLVNCLRFSDETINLNPL